MSSNIYHKYKQKLDKKSSHYQKQDNQILQTHFWYLTNFVSSLSINEETCWSFVVIFIDHTRLDVIKNSAIRNVISTSCQKHRSSIGIQNNMIISFLMIKVTKCWNSHVVTLDNNKYEYLAKLQHVSSLIERLCRRNDSPLLSSNMRKECLKEWKLLWNIFHTKWCKVTQRSQQFQQDVLEAQTVNWTQNLLLILQFTSKHLLNHQHDHDVFTFAVLLSFIMV